MSAEQLLLMHKKIDLAASTLLYDRPLSQEALEQDWQPRGGTWWFEDGGFYGMNPLAAPGCLLSRFPCTGNVLVDFLAQTVPPSTHDIDVMWNVTWNEADNTRGLAYVAGVQGWWDGKVGVEKSPAYKLVAATPCPWFAPGKQYHIQAGSIDGHCFVLVDGKLMLEVFDTDPIDSQASNRVGFEAYQSMIRIHNIKVYRIAWTPRKHAYPAEF